MSNFSDTTIIQVYIYSLSFLVFMLGFCSADSYLFGRKQIRDKSLICIFTIFSTYVNLELLKMIKNK